MAGSFGKRGVIQQRAAAAPQGAATAFPPLAPTVLEARPAAAAPAWRVPFVTLALLALLCIVFACEVRFAPVLYGGMAPPVGALIAYGAVDGALVFHAGEWWRVFTAPMLHGSLSHLLSNAAVFAVIGFMLEPLIGSRWFAALYAVGGLGGAICSLLLDPPDIPAVGASGAIMGVLAGAFLCGASAKAGQKGRKMQSWALRMMLPALIPLAADSHVDYAGHLGGVIAGLFMGVLLQLVWSRGEDRPALGEIAASIGAASLCAALLALTFGARFGDAEAATAALAPGLIPDTQLPRGDSVGTEEAARLVARYPHDPRAHFYRGIAFISDGRDLADAEEQFRAARDPAAVAAAGLAPAFAKTATVMLALTIAYEHRPEEARALGGPLCDFAAGTLEDDYALMQKAGICAGPPS